GQRSGRKWMSSSCVLLSHEGATRQRRMPAASQQAQTVQGREAQCRPRKLNIVQAASGVGARAGVSVSTDGGIIGGDRVWAIGKMPRRLNNTKVRQAGKGCGTGPREADNTSEVWETWEVCI